MTTLENKYNQLLDEYCKYIFNDGADYKLVVSLYKDLYRLLITSKNPNEKEMISSGLTTASYMLLGLINGTLINDGIKYRYTRQNNCIIVEVDENDG